MKYLVLDEEIEYNDLGLENYYEQIKEEDDLRSEFVEIERIYDLLVTEQDIANMISKLEKLEILGENVLKFWDKDKIYCELKIKNPEYIIKTKNIELF